MQLASGAKSAPEWLDFIVGPRPEPRARRATVHAVDLFSSVGGLSLGLQLAAADLELETSHIAAVDIDRAALAVHRANLGNPISIEASVGSIVDYSIHGAGATARFAYTPELLGDLGLDNSRLDVLVAGPPCQGHSNLNNKTRRDDPRNALYLAVPAVAVAANASAVIIENVPEVTAAKGDLVPTAIALLESAGYDVVFGVLRATDVGWPQTRRRFFLVATRGWSPTPFADVVEAQRAEPGGINWLLEDLLDRDAVDFMDETPSLTAVNEARIDLLFTEGLFDLPNHARPDCHKDGTTYGATYGRMKWDAPAPTITTGFGTPGRGRFVHPLRRRVLTPREAARIQGFPDWFDFAVEGAAPTRSQLTTWIGNAVPAPLGRIAALSALTGRPTNL